MAGIKVFGHPASIATRRVLIALHEKNLDFELVHVELKDGEHKKEPFLSRNVSISIYLCVVVRQETNCFHVSGLHLKCFVFELLSSSAFWSGSSL